MKAIEGNFPFEYLSEVAEIESWRKELYRPIYYMHKWWARRLGSVFRAVTLGAFLDENADIMAHLYESIDLAGVVVFDPFMGSGTTVGEAHKLGCTVLGRDINPVAYRLSKIALSNISRQKLLKQVEILREQVEQDLVGLYKSLDSSGQVCDVLYYFWVKVLPCPNCENQTDLFPTYIFAKHAYPKKYPEIHIVCPDCSCIFQGLYTDKTVLCPDCRLTFNPHIGNTRRTTVSCRSCGTSFPIMQTALSQNCPPEHRLYAKLILSGSGKKDYLKITEADLYLYKQAQSRLQATSPLLPHIKIDPGYNTQQILNYGYQYWDQMFNDRQLLALSILANGIKNLTAGLERDVLILLFSGLLEFNNIFASYKGEGTGAVRHLFSHHILKPERMPIEANLWGTPKSSGSFLNLFRSRVLRALDYKEAPFEVMVNRNGKGKGGQKKFGVSPPIGANILDVHSVEQLQKKAVYLSCGDSATTDIPPCSVDVVITDPPFFDNVHYSELADFFFVWQQLYFADQSIPYRQTTRHPSEVQDTNVDAFARKLTDVFNECHRVLCDDGLLIFSYHHSRNDGWLSVAQALLGSNFVLVQAQPVKAEMSVATPKSQAKNPIDLDVFLVCKKRDQDKRPHLGSMAAFKQARKISASKIKRFNKLARTLSVNDVKVVLYSQLLVELSAGRGQELFEADFANLISEAEQVVEVLWEEQSKNKPENAPADYQLTLF